MVDFFQQLLSPKKLPAWSQALQVPLLQALWFDFYLPFLRLVAKFLFYGESYCTTLETGVIQQLIFRACRQERVMNINILVRPVICSCTYDYAKRIMPALSRT